MGLEALKHWARYVVQKDRAAAERVGREARELLGDVPFNELGRMLLERMVLEHTPAPETTQEPAQEEIVVLRHAGQTLLRHKVLSRTQKPTATDFLGDVRLGPFGRGQAWRLFRVTAPGTADLSQLLATHVSAHAFLVSVGPECSFVLCKVADRFGRHVVKFGDLAVETLLFVEQGRPEPSVFQAYQKLTLQATHLVTNMTVKAAAAVGRLTFTDLCREISGLTAREWLNLRADARAAKATSSESPLQAAVNLMRQEACEFMDALHASAALTYSVSDPKHNRTWGLYPQGLTLEMQECRGIAVTEDLQVLRPTFTEFVMGTMSLNRCGFLIGGSGVGKSTCLHVCGRTWTVMAGKDRYLFTKSLDVIGTLAKSGTMADLGAMTATDFECESLQSSDLSLEGLKVSRRCPRRRRPAC